MIASPDTAAPTTAHDHEDHQADTYASRLQAWAHELVLQIIESNLPLTELARLNQIPFQTLREYVSTPEVQTEIDAYEELVALRARLLGQTARPISIRKMLDVLETPTPRPLGHDPESDQRALHRHAELIRRTAATIARESRAIAPGGTALGGTALGGSALGGSALGGTALGGTALQSGVNHPDTASHQRTERDTTPDGPAPDGPAPDGPAPDGSALGGSALGGSALGGSALGGTTLQSGVNHPDTSSHPRTERDTTPDGPALGGSALGGSALGGTTLQSGVNHPDTASHQRTERDTTPNDLIPGGSALGGTTLQSGVNHPDTSSPQSTEQDSNDASLRNTDHEVDDSALDHTAHDASSLLTTARSTRARDHPFA